MSRFRYREVEEPRDDPNRDYSRVRTIEVEGNRINLTQTDPYGHWFISWDKGKLPERLSGAYTSYPLAREAILNHLENTGRKVIKIKETVGEKDN